MTSPTSENLAARVQRLEDDAEIRRVTTRMATLADAREWDALAELFTPTVHADWSALSGAPAASVTAEQLVAGWRAGLSGLTATHHLVSNQQVDLAGDRAYATGYVHAAHRLDSAFAGPVWVVAGRYEWRLRRTGDGWRICAATFLPVWGWGNQQVMSAAAATPDE